MYTEGKTAAAFYRMKNIKPRLREELQLFCKFRKTIKQNSWISKGFCSVVQWCLTFCNPMNFSMPDFPVLHSLSELLKLMCIGSVMPSNHLILCHPLIFWPSIFPSIRVFPVSYIFTSCGQRIGASASASVPSNEYSGLISVRIDQFDLLALQGTFKSLLQHHSSEASILWHSAFFLFIVQLSHPYMTTGETIALTIQTFVDKLLCLCFLIHCLGLSLLFFQRASIV